MNIIVKIVILVMIIVDSNTNRGNNKSISINNIDSTNNINSY